MNNSKIIGLVAYKMVMLLAFVFSACSENADVSPIAHDGGWTEEQAYLENIKVVAYARRSYESIADDSTMTRFVSSIESGSIIRMSELDSVNFDTTGLVYYSRAEDATGVFYFDNVSLKSPYVMLELSASCGNYKYPDSDWVEGCHDVYEGKFYAAYGLIVDLRKSKNIGINVVTTIETKRLQRLIGLGMSFENAKLQAESEILATLGLYGVPYRFDEPASDDNHMEMMFSDYLGDWLAYSYSGKSVSGAARVFAELGSFNPSVGGYLAKKVNEWFKSRWTDKEAKVYLHDYMLNFMASLFGLGRCAAENDGYSTTLSFDKHKNIDFVCENGNWSYLVYYVVPDSLGAVLGQMTDSRDGEKYNTVTYNIDGKTQTWLAENLKFNSVDGEYFFHEVMNLPDSVALIPYESCIEENTYRYCDRLETGKRNFNYERFWAVVDSVETAGKTYQGICPDGWHLPDLNEWKKLRGYVIKNVDIHSLKGEEDIMAIAGFGESDAEKGTSYAVKIDSAFGSYYARSRRSPVISVFVQLLNWTYEDLHDEGMPIEKIGINKFSVRCVKD